MCVCVSARASACVHVSACVCVCSCSSSEISHLCSQDDLMTDPIAGDERLAKCFHLSCPLKIAQESSCAPPSIWSDVGAWSFSKGIRACRSKCLCVSGGTLLYFKSVHCQETNI